MAQSESIQVIVNHTAMQATIAVMMVLRDIDVGPQPATTASLRVTKAETWWTSVVKALTQLECPGQVYCIAYICDGSHKHS